MSKYDFKALSPIDFEILVRDLLQEELGVRLESFKSGRDKGIDFRFCQTTDQSLVIQCKHYAESSYPVLFRQLKSNEVQKVIQLKPSRYILATSIGLTPDQKNQLMQLFKPFIHVPGDIYGRDDINNLLTRFPSIEKMTFKLWLTSVPLFEEILHGKVKNISRDELEKIREHAKYYVYNNSFSEAIRILNSNNLCIIAGIPGIGKTTLAEMLILHFVDLGYEIVKVTGDISEARSLDYVKTRRVFYYDDFLGQTSLSEKLNKNEDQDLLDFMAAIKRSKVSKLILTTREYILNQARMVYEKLSRSRFDTETYVVDLSKYTRLNRAQILFNHIYFSDISRKYKQVLLQEKNYLKVIDHENYSPRLIDLMTQSSRIVNIEPSQYVIFFINNLENPLEIWRHAFEEQLSQESRNLLLVMTFMPREVFLEDLREAFFSFHHGQALNYKFKTSPQDFIHALKELDANFISTDKSRDRTIVRFHNPSVRDFLQNYLASSEAEFRGLLRTAIFYDQVIWLWRFRENKIIAQRFKQLVTENLSAFVDRLRATINLRTCELVNRQDSGGELYKASWNMGYEDRVTIVAAISKELNTNVVKIFLDELMMQVGKHIDQDDADPWDLVRLSKELKGTEVLKGPFLEKVKAFLLSRHNYVSKFEYISDFEPFCEFMEIFPEIVTVDEKISVQVSIKKASQLSAYGLNPDDLRTNVGILKSLAKEFDLDMAEKVEELETLAKELEAELPKEPSEHGRKDTETDFCTDMDIESIFEILR